MTLNVLLPQISAKYKPAQATYPSIVIIIPTYCEEENIETLIHKIQKLHLDKTILVIDDSSPDKTQQIVKALNKEYHNIILLSRPKKLGLGTAITAGFRYVLKLNPQPDYIITMDSDFSHNPSDIPRLVESAENGNELVIGSRYVSGGKMNNWSMKRQLISRFANIIASLVIGKTMKDYTSGFRCYSTKYVKIALNFLHSSTFEIQIETIRQAKLNRFKISEIPITFEERVYGNSKLSTGEFLAFLVYITKSWIANISSLLKLSTRKH